MKIFIHHDFPTLKRVDSEGGRTYLTPEGHSYPSVTTVAGFKNQKHIYEWRKRVGEDEANKISSRASKRGTAIHSLCEDYLKTGKASPSIFDQELFNGFIPILKQIDHIEAIEQPMYSNSLKVAGTVDLIACLNGVPSIIDWKTSSRLKRLDDIEHYFIQTCMYSQMFFEHTKIVIKQLAVIIGVDNHEPQVFIEHASDWAARAYKCRQYYREKTGI